MIAARATAQGRAAEGSPRPPLRRAAVLHAGRDHPHPLSAATRHLYRSHVPSGAERMAVVATGGYGRGLMAPESDIDLLFILPYKQTAWGEQVAEAILYCLWDMGLKVGHATRSVDECIRQARGDMTIRTAILETRFLTGDQPLYDELVALRQGGRAGHRGRIRRPPSSPSARAPLAAPGNRAIWSSPTSRTARAACATCTRCSGSPNTSTACARPTSWSSAACSTRRNTAPSAAAPISCGRCAATCISRPGAPRSGCRSTCSARSPSGLGYTSHPGMQDVERFMKHYFLVAKDVGDLTAILCAKLEDEQAKPAPVLEPHGGALRPARSGGGARQRRLHHRQQPHQPRGARCLQARPGQPDPDLPAGAEEQPRLPPRRDAHGDALAEADQRPAARKSRKPTGCSWRS